MKFSKVFGGGIVLAILGAAAAAVVGGAFAMADDEEQGEDDASPEGKPPHSPKPAAPGASSVSEPSDDEAEVRRHQGVRRAA
jgi:hypothetical protein